MFIEGERERERESEREGESENPAQTESVLTSDVMKKAVDFVSVSRKPFPVHKPAAVYRLVV